MLNMTNTTTEAGTEFLRNVDEVLDGYIACLVWSGLDWPEDQTEEPGPLDENYSVDDVTDEARETMRAEIQDFVWHNLTDCLAYVDECRNGNRIGYRDGEGSPWAWIGHDIALTRNGHGAGFWDRGLGDLGDRLTAACKPYGEQNLWPNAEGGLEVEG